MNNTYDIFISYRRDGGEFVGKVIYDKLCSMGYRCFFDVETMRSGKFNEQLYRVMEECQDVLVVLSPGALDRCVNDGDWVRNEIVHAMSLDKNIIPVMLRNFMWPERLPEDICELPHYEGVNASSEYFDASIEKITKLLSSTPAEVPVPASPTGTPAPAPEKKRKLWPMIAAAAGAAVVLAACITVPLLLKDDGETSKPGTEQTSQPEGSSQPGAPVTMSDNLYDYTFAMDGVVYKLPCDYATLTQAGWTIYTNGYSGDKLVNGDSKDSFEMVKEGKRIAVSSYNLSGNAKKIKDCKIGAIEVYVNNGPAFSVAKGITAASTPEEIEAALGIPSDTYTGSSYTKLTYQEDTDTSNGVVFYCDEETKYSHLMLANYIKTDADKTETNKEVPAYLSTYKAPTALGEDITSGIVSIEGDLYQIPAPASAFIDKGWTVKQQPGAVAAGKTDSIRLERDGKSLDLYVMNLAEYQTLPLNCAVYRIAVYDSDETVVSLPSAQGAVGIGDDKAAVTAAITDNFDYYDGSSSDQYSYSEYKERDFSVYIHVSKESGKVSQISVSCKTWDYK